MKVILSRKGFDSEYGGHPSPFVVGQKMHSFPIPSSKGGIPYKNIKFSKDASVKDVIEDLKIKIKSKSSNGKQFCHLDPDIDYSALKRLKNWRGSFGQCDKAQGHLKNQGVSKGDLFLFFGWFRRAIYENKKLRFTRSEGDFHALFGYLFIEEILTIGLNDKVPEWLKYHPHCETRLRKTTGNTIYIAKRFIANNQPGFGCFKASDKLILTKKGYSKSKWNLPKDIFSDARISYHNKLAWKDDYFDSAKRGQEFVINDNKKVTDWAINLIKTYA